MKIIEREEVLTQENVKTRLSHKFPVANKIVFGLYLSGWKYNHDIDLSEVICVGDLSMGGTMIKGSLYIRGAEIKGNLYLDEAEIEEDFRLDGTSVDGNLDLSNVIIGGVLYLRKITINGWINLTTKSGPKMIFVSPNMAELVHWAAPTIPLVVVR